MGNGAVLIEMEEILQGGGVCTLVVSGDNMAPILQRGRDRVLLQCKKPRRGSIILLQRETGKPVLTRVLKRFRDGCLEVCGDGQSWKETVFPEQVVAVVTRISRNQKKFRRENKLTAFFWRMLLPIRSDILSASLKRAMKAAEKQQKADAAREETESAAAEK